jgi:hypothetical protein
MNKQDNVPQVKTVTTPITGSADYIEKVYGTRTFARALMVDDAKSIMDLMDDFSDRNAAPFHKRIAELEAGLKQCQSDRDELQKQSDKLKKYFAQVKFLIRGYRPGDAIPDEIRAVVEQALNSKEVGGE